MRIVDRFLAWLLEQSSPIGTVVPHWFTCRHRRVLFDRVNGRACWRCADCLKVRER